MTVAGPTVPPQVNLGIPQHKETTTTSSSTTLFHHSLITTDSDALKFHAAASLQLQFGGQPHDYYSAARSDDDLLIASPYNNPLHLLDLKTLDVPNRLVAKALTIFKPVRDDYATAEYAETFNWTTVFTFLRDLVAAERSGDDAGYRWTRQEFYVVVFRSKLFPDTDLNRLHELDMYSHQEAMASGGLLKYWFGSKDGNCRNLATCIWRNRNDARLGGLGPWHLKARMAARELYEQIVFKTMKLTVDDDVSNWEFSEWKETPHDSLNVDPERCSRNFEKCRPSPRRFTQNCPEACRNSSHASMDGSGAVVPACANQQQEQEGSDGTHGGRLGLRIDGQVIRNVSFRDVPQPSPHRPEKRNC